MSDGGEIPVSAIVRIRLQLHDAIVELEWDTCVRLADEVCQQIKLAMNPVTCQIGDGKVHLDGVFNIGTMHYEDAPRRAKRALNKMNRIIKTAKGTLR